MPSGISEGVLKSQVLSRFQASDFGEIVFACARRSDRFRIGELLGAEIKSPYRLISQGDRIAEIYTRSVLDFLYVYFLRLLFRSKCRLGHDFRGLVSEESYLRNSSLMRRTLLRLLERFAYYKADRLFTISKNMSVYLRSHYFERNIEVTPCLVSKKDIVLRKLNRNARKISFVYVGSMSRWQCFARACQLYKSLDILDKSFVVVTKEVDRASKIIRSYSISARVVSGDKSKVFEELDAADFGFVLRDNSLINRTASPIKFLEYTARGVIPIMTNHVGDYSNEFGKIALLVDDDCTQLEKARICMLMQQPSILTSLHEKTLEYTW